MQTYEVSCPMCGAKSSEGYTAPSSWWETRCRRCKGFYHYGTIPREGVPSYFEFRCPHEDAAGFVCRRMSCLGVLEPGSWFETKCIRCHNTYHYGHRGEGKIALVTSISQPFAFHSRVFARMTLVEVPLV